MIIRAISDTHGYLPKIEACDLLIHAGDICPDSYPKKDRSFPNPDGQNKWLNGPFKDWYTELPVGQVVSTWGNHDFVGEHYESVHISVDKEVATIAGRVYLTPWVTHLPMWAFNRSEQELVSVYENIPEGLDILVTHAPPFGYGDECYGGHVGGKALRMAILKKRPKVVICGHIHPAYGKFDLDGIPIYNVACVDDNYDLVRGATEIVLPC